MKGGEFVLLKCKNINGLPESLCAHWGFGKRKKNKKTTKLLHHMFDCSKNVLPTGNPYGGISLN